MTSAKLREGSRKHQQSLSNLPVSRERSSSIKQSSMVRAWPAHATLWSPVNSLFQTAFPIQGTKLVHAVKYAESLCGRTAKVVVELPDGRIECYFLKVSFIIIKFQHGCAVSKKQILRQVVMGETGAQRCEGEYESLKAVYAVSPGFAPIPYAWGKCKNQASEAYFLLEEFRYVRKQVSRATSPFPASLYCCAELFGSPQTR